MNILLFASLLVAATAASNEASYNDRAVYVNGTASPFEKIIKTFNVGTKEPIHSTPAVVLIGKKNGDILRCLQEDPNECEIFYQTGSYVYSLLISGEYIYAGLHSGAILRCQLSVKGSCSTFHMCGRHVMSLEVVGGYLYAGLDGNSTMMRCALDQVNSCHLLHTMKHQVCALKSFKDHIYTGMFWSGQLSRCSLRTENTCTPIHTMGSGIVGLANIGNNLIALTWNGQMWNCSQKSDSNIDYCVQTRILGKSDMWDLVAYKGVLYAVNKKGIYICDSVNGTDCSNYGRHTGALSVAFSYSTYHMQSRYKGEHTTCTWQNNHRCPPFVTYYNPHQRSILEVHVKDGKLRNSVGNLVDTTLSNDGQPGAAIFAMGPDGRLLLSNVRVPQLVVTSSLFAGSPVAGAGEMFVENGVIKKMTTCSEHYRPDLALNRQVVDSLRWQGYTAAIDSQACCQDEECDGENGTYLFEELSETRSIF